MKRIVLITVGFVIAFYMVLTALDAHRVHRFATRAARIRAGNSREQVRAALGRPTVLAMPPAQIPAHGCYLGVRVETWAYGGRFQFRHCLSSDFPYFCPLNIRLFGPTSDDLRIRFDAAGKVTRVQMSGT